MTLEKIDLRNLPTVWQAKNLSSKDEEDESKVDGSKMTVNPEEKYRKKRIVTPAANTKWKRVTRVQELLNYCRWKVGELETCEKPVSTILNVLHAYRKGELDKISEGYMAAIETHKDLVDRAIATMDKPADKSTAGSWLSAGRIAIAKEKFTLWLESILSGSSCESKKAYVDYVKLYLNWKLTGKRSKLLKDWIIEICDVLIENPSEWKVNTYTHQILHLTDKIPELPEEQKKYADESIKQASEDISNAPIEDISKAEPTEAPNWEAMYNHKYQECEELKENNELLEKNKLDLLSKLEQITKLYNDAMQAKSTSIDLDAFVASLQSKKVSEFTIKF